jgi:hypothetical protein
VQNVEPKETKQEVIKDEQEARAQIKAKETNSDFKSLLFGSK